MIEITNILDIEKLIDHLDAVVFDLDDTLYSEKEYVRSGFAAVADYFNDHSMVDELWSAFEAGKKAIDAIMYEKGLEDRKEEALRIYRSHVPDIHLYPGVGEMLLRVSRTKKVGIITDGRPDGQRAKIEVMKLEACTNEIIITDELGGLEFRKPNEKAFLLMQKKFKVPFNKMAYIGDNVGKDFIAPEKLGMHSIHFDNPDGLYQ